MTSLASDKGAGASVSRIILISVLLGPFFGTAIFNAPMFFSRGDLPEAVVALVLGYIYGAIPALVGGVSFSILRKRLGQTYRCAAVSGLIGGLISPFSPLIIVVGGGASGKLPSFGILLSGLYLPVVFGVVPGLLVFLVAHKLLGLRRFTVDSRMSAVLTPRRFLVGLALILLAPFAFKLVNEAMADGYRTVRVGHVGYRIPVEFQPGHKSGEDALLMQFSLPGWGPLGRNISGWEDNVNVLITPQPAPIAKIYDLHWDGTPVNKDSKGDAIERTYRADPELTVQEMGAGFDIVIPDQDRDTMPLGIMRCTRPREFFPNTHCALLFDRDGQRWKVTFGRQFMPRYAEFRARATALMDDFRTGDE